MIIFGSLPMQADKLVAYLAALVISIIVGGLIWLIKSPKVRLPRLMEVGMMLVALGAVVSGEPAITDYAGSTIAAALRLCLMAGGLALIIVSGAVTWRQRKASGCPMRRSADSMPVALDRPLHRSFGEVDIPVSIPPGGA